MHNAAVLERYRGALRTLGVIVGVGITFVMLLPTLYTWAYGRYQPRTLINATSPDGRYRIVGTLRADLPANDILDPSATLRIDLTDTRTASTLDRFVITLHEYGDFNEKATVTWQDGGRVWVSDIDDEHHLTATLSIHGWEAK